jgi:hypothetical protein
MGIDDLFGNAPKGNSLANSRKDDLNGRKAVLIGDALTSGVTLSASTHARLLCGRRSTDFHSGAGKSRQDSLNEGQA